MSFPVHPHPASARRSIASWSGTHGSDGSNRSTTLPSRTCARDRIVVPEEAPALGKPILVMRDVTERPEGVEAGVAELVGTDKERIVAWVGRLTTEPETYASMASVVHLYGDGRAGVRIAAVLAARRRRKASVAARFS